MPLSHDHDDDRQIVLHGGREFLPVHQEIAVAGKRKHRALRIEPLHRRPRPARHIPSSLKSDAMMLPKRRKR